MSMCSVHFNGFSSAKTESLMVLHCSLRPGYIGWLYRGANIYPLSLDFALSRGSPVFTTHVKGRERFGDDAMYLDYQEAFFVLATVLPTKNHSSVYYTAVAVHHLWCLFSDIVQKWYPSRTSKLPQVPTYLVFWVSLVGITLKKVKSRDQRVAAKGNCVIYCCSKQCYLSNDSPIPIHG